jgi:hypothetical protein
MTTVYKKAQVIEIALFLTNCKFTVSKTYTNHNQTFNIVAIRLIPSVQVQIIIGSRYTLMYNHPYATQ